jgi:adenylyltransferase/sulfurtransferase
MAVATTTTIAVPTPLRQYAGGKAEVEVQGASVGEALAELTKAYPELKRQLYGEGGKLRAFVNVYVNDEDIRYLQGEATPLRTGDALFIVPSIAGGI